MGASLITGESRRRRSRRRLSLACWRERHVERSARQGVSPKQSTWLRVDPIPHAGGRRWLTTERASDRSAAWRRKRVSVSHAVGTYGHRFRSTGRNRRHGAGVPGRSLGDGAATPGRDPGEIAEHRADVAVGMDEDGVGVEPVATGHEDGGAA